VGSIDRFLHLLRDVSGDPVSKLLGTYVGQFLDHLLVKLEIVTELAPMLLQEFLRHPFYVSRFYIAHINPVLK